MLNTVGDAPKQISIFQDQQRKTGSNQFSDVMAAASRPHSAEGLNFDSIKTAYEKWSHQRRADGADSAYMDRVDAAKQTYLSIISKAAAGGGFKDPLAFVKTLTSEELQAIQTTQSLAREIDPSSLSAEGAFNLLLPRNMAQDLDGDGKFMVGLAETVVFPPGNAPQSVRDAWDKTTSSMDFELKMHLQISLYATGQMDADGAGGWSDMTDYVNLIDRAVDGAQYNLGVAAPEHRAFAERILAGLALFQANFHAGG